MSSVNFYNIYISIGLAILSGIALWLLVMGAFALVDIVIDTVRRWRYK